MSMGNYPFPDRIMNFSNSEKDAQREKASALLRSVCEAVNLGKKEIRIEEGYYRFGHPEAPAFVIKGAENIEFIGGENVEFIQETRYSVIRLTNCKNVLLSGIKVDYAELKYVQFTVCGFNQSGEPILTVDDNYKPNFEKYKDLLIGSRILYYDCQDLSRELVSSNTRGFLRDLTDLGDGRYQITYRDQITTMLTPTVDIKPGDKAVIFVFVTVYRNINLMCIPHKVIHSRNRIKNLSLSAYIQSSVPGISPTRL